MTDRYRIAAKERVTVKADNFAMALVARDQDLRLTIETLIADMIHFAQTVHQAHHGEDNDAELSGQCQRGVCGGVWRSVQRARQQLQDLGAITLDTEAWIVRRDEQGEQFYG